MFFTFKKLFQTILQREIYLDHAATTPMDARVFSVMKKIFKDSYGNAGGMYQLAIDTKTLIHESRKKVAVLLGTTSDHIVFTRGGTESNNIAIIGTVNHFKVKHPDMVPHIITSTIEHDSVLETVRNLEQKKIITASYIPCDEDGIVITSELKKQLRPETILVSIMYANNEIGTIQSIREITKLIRWYKKQLQEQKKLVTSDQYPLVHTDAIQAVNYCDINVMRLGVDMMTLSGSKIYGPKSVGALFVKNKELLDPIMFGGGHEFGLRSGTEDVAMIAGFVKALQISNELKDKEVKRLTQLRDYLISELEKDVRIKINGSKINRLPNNCNITIAGFSSESLVIILAAKGFAVSSKSACQSDSDEESHVIAAIRSAQGIDSRSEEGSLRITLGRSTTKNDIKKFLRVFWKIVGKK
jgi:cysteine desulfurase